MRKILMGISLVFILTGLMACSDNSNDINSDEALEMIEVDFQVPENAEIGETITLESEVTYKDEPVTDAEVEFEIWLSGDEDNSEMIDPENNNDGTYSLDYTFDEAGVYEMYAHTTAKSMHNMPKKSITVGDVEASHNEDEANEDDHAHFHTEGFDLHFISPDEVKKDEEIVLSSHITMDEEPLKNLSVQYEIQFQDDEDNIEWLKASELPGGEYEAKYKFSQTGAYEITVHVKDEADLHEHLTEKIKVQ